MRRVLAATFLLAALATPGAAQMRAMRSSAPMRPFGRPSMGLSRPMGMRPVFGSRPAFTPLGPRTSFRREGFASFSHHGPIFVHRPFFPRHHRVFFSTFPFGSPYLLGASIYPYPSDYPYLADYPGVYASDTSAYQQSSDDSYNRLSSQLDQLNSQMQLLRDQNESLRSDMERQQQRTREQASTPPEAPTVLVFRDGHRTETQNYAVVGQTVWILSANHATKVPVANLDLDQTIKVNQDRGTTFLIGKPTN